MGYGCKIMIAFECADKERKESAHVWNMAAVYAQELRDSTTPLQIAAAAEGGFNGYDLKAALSFFDDLANQDVHVREKATYAWPPLLWASNEKNASADEVVRLLVPFFERLLKYDHGNETPGKFEHVLIFVQEENADLWVTEVKIDIDAPGQPVVTNGAKCPFSFDYR